MTYISQIKRLLLGFCLLILFAPQSFAAFNDVSESHPNFQAIEFVQNEGIVNGYADGTYKPDQKINRAEFTKITIESQFDVNEIESCLNENVKPEWEYVFFPDVPKNAWFSKYICVAKMNNVVAGYPDGTYKPDQNISFVEAAKIIVNVFGFVVEEDQIWYKPFVEILGLRGAIPPTINSFPQQITRGEMAEIIYRLKVRITNLESQTYASLAGESEEGVEMSLEDIQAMEYDYVGELKDMTGGNSSGVAKSVFQDGRYMLYVTFNDLPTPQEGEFFVGWIKNETTGSLINTGIVGVIENNIVNLFMAEGDLTDHQVYFLTLEDENSTGEPGKKIVEGGME